MLEDRRLGYTRLRVLVRFAILYNCGRSAVHLTTTPKKRLNMQIREIRVQGLFGRFTHEIAFEPDDRIKIIYGPNGVGKTVTLRIINDLFNRSLLSLLRIPFQRIEVTFDNNNHLEVVRTNNEAAEAHQSYAPSTVLNFIFNDNEPYMLQLSDLNEFLNPRLIDAAIPNIHRIGPNDWMDFETDERYDIEDLWELYADVLLEQASAQQQELPAWLDDLRESVPVQFIDTERLFTTPASVRPGTVARRRHVPAFNRTVTKHSTDLANRIRQVLTKYGNESQSLDSSFLERLIQRPADSQVSLGELQALWGKNESKRLLIEATGMLLPEQGQLESESLGSIDESNRAVLELYALDVADKLTVFDELYPRVNMMIEILQSLFEYKQIKVSSNGFDITSDGSNLDLRHLSSGEQHELVLIYDLLFNVRHNSLILIDEPELSLHVAWQEQMLKSFQRIGDLSKCHFLLATHSPQIIDDRWELTVELKGSADS